MPYKFIVSEKIVNKAWREESIRHMKKEIPGSYYFSFFTLRNLLTQPSETK